MKKLFIITILITLSIPLFAGNLKSLRTEHFEIVYPDESEPTAEIIYANAENIYTSVSSLIGNLGEELFLPVVIRPDVKSLNAYYTSYPYHRIVLYDTFANPSGTLNYKEKMLDIFTHELTHAMLFNHKDRFWQIVGNIFSDSFTIQGLYVHPSFSEGLSVYAESREGYGRLNNNYFLHTVKQAKIEGDFPTWYKTIGSADYGATGGSAYSYGGPFVAYLAYAYGEEKLSEFFTKSSHLVFKTVSSLFEETFGADIEEVWQDFHNSIKIPGKILRATNITPRGSYQNIFIVNNKLYTLNRQKNLIEVYNARTGEFVSSTDSYSALNFSVSADEKIILGLYANVESKVIVLSPVTQTADKNTANNKKKNQKPYSYFEIEHQFNGYYAGFALGGGRTALLRNKGSVNYIDLYNSRNILYKTITLPYGADLSSFSVYNDRYTGMILTKGSPVGCSYLAFFDNETEEIFIVEGAEDITFKSISGSLFSYAPNYANAAMVRYGLVELEDGKVSLKFSDQDFYGGVFSAAKADKKLYFVAKVSTGDVIYTTPLNLSSLKTIDNVLQGMELLDEEFEKQFEINSGETDPLEGSADIKSTKKSEDTSDLSNSDAIEDSENIEAVEDIEGSEDSEEADSADNSTPQDSSTDSSAYSTPEPDTDPVPDSAPEPNSTFESIGPEFDESLNSEIYSDDISDPDGIPDSEKSEKTEANPDRRYTLTPFEGTIYESVYPKTSKLDKQIYSFLKTTKAPSDTQGLNETQNLRVWKPFSSLPYLLKGTLIPIATYSDSNDSMPGLGITYITADPYDRWSAGTSLGYNFSKNRAFGTLSAEEILSKNYYLAQSVQYHYNTKTEKSYFEGEAALRKNQTNPDGISYAAELFINPIYEKDWDANVGAGFSFSGAKSKGRGPLDYTSFQMSYRAKYSLNNEKVNSHSNGSFKLAHLLPLDFKNNKFTINLPITFSFSYSSDEEMNFTTTVIPFAMEIQGGTKAIPFYFNRLVTTAGYKKRHYLNDKEAENVYFTGVNLVSTPTIGIAAGNVFCSFGFTLNYTTSKSSSGKFTAGVNFGLSM